jgi:sugar phosphate isomerase/epimerase
MAAAGASISLSRLKGAEFIIDNTAIARKIHVFSKPLGWLNYEDMAILLSEAGAEGIDITVRPEGHVLPENVVSDLPRAVEAARKHGLSVEMIVTGIVRQDPSAELIIKTASSLGIKFYRLGWLSYDDSLGISGTISKYRSDLIKLEELNRKYGIHGAYQNHAGTMVGGAVWDLYELLKDLDPEFIGCQYDIRHAVVEGGTSWSNGLKLIAPWIKCTDIKDFKWEETNGKWNTVSVPLGEGMVDFDDYFRIIRSKNITGPMSLHFEYPPFENFKGTLSDSDKRKLFIKEAKRDIDKLKSFRSKYQL